MKGENVVSVFCILVAIAAVGALLTPFKGYALPVAILNAFLLIIGICAGSEDEPFSNGAP